MLIKGVYSCCYLCMWEPLNGKQVLGFMHQPDEPKSLSYWEEVSNPLILHNTPTHMQPEQGTNVEIKKGAEDLKDASTKTRTRDLWL